MQGPDAGVLSQWFLQTLSPDLEPRKQAEEHLKLAGERPDFGRVLLQLLSERAVGEQVRLAAAVNFKNRVKYRWRAEDAESAQVLPMGEEEKEQVKLCIVGLMCSMPPKIQSQLSEALVIMSKFDFPHNWPYLLDQLVAGIQNRADYSVINGILQSANSIFKRFRYEFKSQELYRNLKYCLDGFAAPLLELFTATGILIDSNPESPAVLKPLLECQRLCCRIFYSLNFQELPEFFENHMAEWMAGFHKYLIYTNPLLKESDETKESIVDQVKVAICENINLYMEKNEEEFQSFLTEFATDVWNLLMTVSQAPSHDRLATTAIKFLTTVSKSVHHALFRSPSTLKQICESIIIPNLKIREEDEELFEMNHIEYIRRDMEGSDLETRRRMACELIKGLSTQYQEQVTRMFSAYTQEMLAEYALNPRLNWKAKNCAVYLVVSLASRQASEGVAASDLVDVEQFFTTQIVPELRTYEPDVQAILKADALKFLTTFRRQIPKGMMLELLPQVMGFLLAESNVVHSYAASCIEKLLVLKDGRALRYLAGDLAPFVQPLLTNLFGALKLPESQENAYVMKCIMRVLSVTDVGDMGKIVMEELTRILAEVCKNPTNPSFNHYVFEAIAALVRRGCAVNPELIKEFEKLLFPVFENILQLDVVEFAPYVFQVLAQLLETRQPPLPLEYTSIFPVFLNPTLWKRPANVPALVRLLQAYLQKAPEQINQGQLPQVLGVFDMLIKSRNNEHEGFFILHTIVENLPYRLIEGYLPEIFSILFFKLHSHRTLRFIKSLIIFMSLFVVKHGHARLTETVDKVQSNMFSMVLESIWISNLTAIAGELETKLCAVAATMLLSESPVLLRDTGVSTWTKLLDNVVTLLTRPEDQGVEEEPEIPDLDEVVGHMAVFARLYNAGKQEDDPVKEIQDAREFLVTSLSRTGIQQPGTLPFRIQQGLDPKSQAALHQFCTTFGVSFV